MWSSPMAYTSSLLAAVQILYFVLRSSVMIVNKSIKHSWFEKAQRQQDGPGEGQN